MMTEDTANTIRPIAQVVEGMPASDGAGVRLNRVLGQPALDMLDPFLMLDEFKSDRAVDYIAGFPDHPHRGFETVTYMLAGRMRHADNKGNEGVIEAGGVQWMTAGSGIVHSEMPEQEDGLMWGFQLWINLPAAEKMKTPAYQEFDRAAIPEERRDAGCVVRVVAGETASGTQGPVLGITTAPLHLDIMLEAGARFEEPVEAASNAFVYIYQGGASATNAEGTKITLETGSLAVLGDGDTVGIEATGEGAKLLLLAARPIAEPVARYGPFVMNTRAEVMQAFQDMQAGRI